jgi:hypothetical protein
MFWSKSFRNTYHQIVLRAAGTRTEPPLPPKQGRRFLACFHLLHRRAKSRRSLFITPIARLALAPLMAMKPFTTATSVMVVKAPAPRKSVFSFIGKPKKLDQSYVSYQSHQLSQWAPPRANKCIGNPKVCPHSSNLSVGGSWSRKPLFENSKSGRQAKCSHYHNTIFQIGR